MIYEKEFNKIMETKGRPWLETGTMPPREKVWEWAIEFCDSDLYTILKYFPIEHIKDTK